MVLGNPRVRGEFRQVSRKLALLSAVSGVLLYILPTFLGSDGIWYAFTVAEFLVAGAALVYMIRADKTALAR